MVSAGIPLDQDAAVVLVRARTFVGGNGSSGSLEASWHAELLL